MIYKVFTDGSSSRKNETIGTSYVIFKDKSDEPIKTFCKGFIDKQARNGIAELLGVFYFLYDLCLQKIDIKKESEIVIYSDSQYVIKEITEWFRNQMMKNFSETKNKEIIIYILWMLYILRQENYIIKFEWIKGHQRGITLDIYGNNYADSLAVKCHKIFDNLTNIEEFVLKVKKEIEDEKILQNIRKIYLNI